MNCDEFRKNIDDYIDDNQSPLLKAQMLDHSLKCQSCSEELKLMQSIVDTLHMMPKISVPDNFLDKINARIDEEEKVKPYLKIKRFFNYKTYSALAACVLLMVLVRADMANLITNLYDNNAQDGVVISEHLKTTTDENLTGADSNIENQDINVYNSVPDNIDLNTLAPNNKVRDNTQKAIIKNDALEEKKSADSTNQTLNEQEISKENTVLNQQSNNEPIATSTPQTTVQSTLEPIQGLSDDKKTLTQSDDMSVNVYTHSKGEGAKVASIAEAMVDENVFEIAVSKEYMDKVKNILIQIGAVDYNDYYVLQIDNYNNFLSKLTEEKIKYTTTVVSRSENSNDNCIYLKEEN